MVDAIKARQDQDLAADRALVAGDAWILTFTGRRFSLIAPRWSDVDPVDLAMALARQCRFNGHTERFYSVAQHSVLVARRCPPHLRLHGLLHDAAEAYVGDMVRPLKLLMRGSRIALIEERIERAVCARFALGYPPLPDEVHQADAFLLQVERRDLLKPSHDWPALDISLEKHPRIEPLASELAAIQFAREYVHLTDDRTAFDEAWFAERAREV